MPLEISEISVRLTVERSPSPGRPAPAGPKGEQGVTLSPAQIEDIVDRCVREVLRTLRLNGAR